MKFSSERPIYRQIIDFCYAAILAGEWLPGERIPSMRDLATVLTVNTRTIMKAYEYLENYGIISSRRGMGFYLEDDACQRVNEDRHREFFENTLSDVFNQMQLLDISIDEVIEHYKLHKS